MSDTDNTKNSRYKPGVKISYTDKILKTIQNFLVKHNMNEYSAERLAKMFVELHNIRVDKFNKNSNIMVFLKTFAFMSNSTCEEYNNLYDRIYEYYQYNTQTVTKHLQILKYGDVEGNLRWDAYCNKQSKTNSFEYKNEKFGWTKEQFDAYNKSRAVTLNNMIAKYGEDTGTKKFQDYCKLQSYVGTSLQYFVDKYGVEVGNKMYLELNKKKCSYNGNERSRISKLEQTILDTLYEDYDIDLQLSTKGNTYQFYCPSLDKSKKYFYDARISNTNILIEINGDFWHCNPRSNGNRNIKDYNTICESIWARDAAKIQSANDNGFVVFILWEYDWEQYGNKILDKLVEWIKTNPTNNLSSDQIKF